MIAPEDILEQLLQECGYETFVIGKRNRWSRVRAIDYSVVNHKLEFVMAINPEGNVWLGRASLGPEFNVNIYDADSVDRLKEELTKMMEQHRAIHQR